MIKDDNHIHLAGLLKNRGKKVKINACIYSDCQSEFNGGVYS